MPTAQSANESGSLLWDLKLGSLLFNSLSPGTQAAAAAHRQDTNLGRTSILAFFHSLAPTTNPFPSLLPLFRRTVVILCFMPISKCVFLFHAAVQAHGCSRLIHSPRASALMGTGSGSPVSHQLTASGATGRGSPWIMIKVL